jgi:hypothetical protein
VSNPPITPLASSQINHDQLKGTSSPRRCLPWVDRGPGVGLGQVAVRRQVRQQLEQGRAQPFAGRPIQHRPALPQQLHRFRTVYTWWATYGAGGSGLPRGRSVRAARIALRAWSRCQLVTAHTWGPSTNPSYDRTAFDVCCAAERRPDPPIWACAACRRPCAQGKSRRGSAI